MEDAEVQSIFEAEDAEEFLTDLRRLQTSTKCTNKTCMGFIQLFSKYVDTGKMDKTFSMCDKKMQEMAGVQFFQLDGCTKCNRHVYGPEDHASRCPKCQSPRYDATGKALEVG